jgi:flagellin-like hook-associated protein FlgL
VSISTYIAKQLEDIAMKKFYIFSLTLVSLGLATNLSSETLSEMEARIGQMGVVELQDRRAYLLQEQEGTQNPSRLKEIADELSAIQKALVALVGAAVISNVTDDGYNDNVPPVITLNGSNPDSVELGNTYSDPGASAFDEFHGETPVSASSNVDTSTVGSYTITYTATDLDGNTATATRTVNVVDTTAPVVTVTGDNPATVELGGTYTDAGATATDASGAVTVVTSGDTVDPDTLGTYTITYTSTDASGNSGTASRTVNVVDSTAPVFTSSSTFVVDEGATAVGTASATDIQISNKRY